MEDNIGSRIKSARLKAGFTQKSFAEALGVTQSAVAKYENGHIKVTADIIEKISLVTGQSLNALYGTTINTDTTNDIFLIEEYHSLNDKGKKGCMNT